MSFQSANQQYKLSGSSLSFTEWIEREKAKGVVIPKEGVTDVFETEMSKVEQEVEVEPKNSKRVLGLNRNMLMLSGLVIVGAIAYKFYANKE
jgi:hypothetical protein|tara:strand:+ start:679 stop:954 length:276 start_codon:yes stop_codon:yes gene_type:complete